MGLNGVIACPRCGEQNLPGKSPMLEVQRNGVVYCTICSKTFTPEDK